MNNLRKRIYATMIGAAVLAVATCCLFPDLPPSKEEIRQLEQRHFLVGIAKKIYSYQSSHHGDAPDSMGDILEPNFPLMNLERLSVHGVDQSWKPKGWYTNPVSANVYSDYVLFKRGNRLIVCERPGIWNNRRIGFLAMNTSETNFYYISRIRAKDTFFSLEGIAESFQEDSSAKEVSHTFGDGRFRIVNYSGMNALSDSEDPHFTFWGIQQWDEIEGSVYMIASGNPSYLVVDLRTGGKHPYWDMEEMPPSVRKKFETVLLK